MELRNTGRWKLWPLDSSPAHLPAIFSKQPESKSSLLHWCLLTTFLPRTVVHLYPFHGSYQAKISRHSYLLQWPNCPYSFYPGAYFMLCPFLERCCILHTFVLIFKIRLIRLNAQIRERGMALNEEILFIIYLYLPPFCSSPLLSCWVSCID